MVMKNAVSSRAKTDLSRLYDELEGKLRALESLGRTKEKFGDFLAPLVESCLPEEVLKTWERNRNHHELCDNTAEKNTRSLENLMTFLRQEVQGEEMVVLARTGFAANQITRKKEYVPAPLNEISGDMATTAALVTGPKPCLPVSPMSSGSVKWGEQGLVTIGKPPATTHLRKSLDHVSSSSGTRFPLRVAGFDVTKHVQAMAAIREFQNHPLLLSRLRRKIFKMMEDLARAPLSKTAVWRKSNLPLLRFLGFIFPCSGGVHMREMHMFSPATVNVMNPKRGIHSRGGSHPPHLW
ncbi:hypothetical protein HNY73_007482 [Argiope bruennichi]|uniref:Uncharacterized protein n=1 Tax=Argiope bruennichi TaxID=94029 RepID=A0A8T0FF02_ARGBR|nr:hypothetical protein HNY73_007482 [Argiope bruennichi]